LTKHVPAHERTYWESIPLELRDFISLPLNTLTVKSSLVGISAKFNGSDMGL
jgi:hypothetical protein